MVGNDFVFFGVLLESQSTKASSKFSPCQGPMAKFNFEAPSHSERVKGHHKKRCLVFFTCALQSVHQLGPWKHLLWSTSQVGTLCSKIDQVNNLPFVGHFCFQSFFHHHFTSCWKGSEFKMLFLAFWVYKPPGSPSHMSSSSLSLS